MSYKLFLSIPSIGGESTTPGFTNQIGVYSFSLGFSNPAPSGGSGSGSGTPSLSDLSILKAYDKSSTRLLRALLEGTVLAPHSGSAFVTLTIAVPSSGTSSVVPLVYSFQDVYVTSIQDSGATGGDNIPTQSVSFSYGIIKETYRPQNSDGSLGSSISITYNSETNQVS